MGNTVVYVPDSVELAAIAQSAVAHNLLLLTNGTRTVLSPVPIDGWTRLRVAFKPQVAQ